MSHERFKSCIDACLACATECDHCASECLHEKDVATMVRCIELDRECAQACYAAARLMGLGGEHATAFCNTVLKYLRHARTNAKSMKWSTANSVPMRAENARTNANPCLE